jgi:hemolysin D
MATATPIPLNKKEKQPSALRAISQVNPLRLETETPEFLPAAMEILQTPPPPIAMWFLLSICGAFVAALIFSYFCWLDILVVAQGKIQSSGLSKVVQPFEAGKIVSIKVSNGSRVKAGDVLFELDPTDSTADREAQAKDLEASEAEVARRNVAIAAARSKLLRPQPINFAPGTSDGVRMREENALAADLAQLASSQATLQAQLAEKIATKHRLNLTIAARQKLIALAKEHVAMRQVMKDKGIGSRTLLIEALQQLENQMTNDAGDWGRLLETDAAIHTLERKIDETTTQFIADQAQKGADAERKRDRLVQDLVKAQSKSNRTLLAAPLAGTIQQLNITTIGQVVTAGQILLAIVPLGEPIEIEAMIANQDIGFVEQGQQALIKVESFPFTRYGTIGGQVKKVSRDAVDEQDATNLSDATNAIKSQSPPDGRPPRIRNLAFPVTIALARKSIIVSGDEVLLTPGMAVTVEIRTGQRRAIEYVLSPLLKFASSTGPEVRQ